MTSKLKDMLSRVSAQFLKTTIALIATLAVGSAWADYDQIWTGETATDGKYYWADNWKDGTATWGNYVIGTATPSATVDFTGTPNNATWLYLENNGTVVFEADSDTAGLVLSGELNIGTGNGTSALTIKKGTYNIKGDIGVASPSAGSLTISDGAVVICENTGAESPIKWVRFGVWSQSGTEGGTADCSINLKSRGTLKAYHIHRYTTAGACAVNFDGGVLEALGDTTDFISSTVSITVGANGGTIDTNGKAITIAAPLTGTGTLLVTGGGSVKFTQTPSCQIFVDTDGTTATVETTPLNLDFEDSETYDTGWTGNFEQGNRDSEGATHFLRVSASGTGSSTATREFNSLAGTSEYIMSFDYFPVHPYGNPNTPTVETSSLELFSSAGAKLLRIATPRPGDNNDTTGRVYLNGSSDAAFTFKAATRVEGSSEVPTAGKWISVVITASDDDGVKITMKYADGSEIVTDRVVAEDFAVISKIVVYVKNYMNNDTQYGGIDNIVATTKDVVSERQAAVVTSSGFTCYGSVAEAISAAVALGAANYDYVAIYGDYEIPMTAAKSGVKVKAMGEAVVTSAISGLNDIEYQITTTTDATSGVTTYTFGNKACTYTWAGGTTGNWGDSSNWKWTDANDELQSATRALDSQDTAKFAENAGVTATLASGASASTIVADETVTLQSSSSQYASSLKTALQNSASWKGTLKLVADTYYRNSSGNQSTFPLANFGNENSTLEFNGACTVNRFGLETFSGVFKITGTVSMGTGNNSGSGTTTINKLAGNGTIAIGNAPNGGSRYQTYVVLDASGFTGSFSITGTGIRNCLGEYNSSYVNTTTSWIVSNFEVGAGATFAASNGFKMRDCTLTVNGNAAFTGAFLIQSGATFAYDSLGTVAFSAQPKFCTALTTGSSTEATSSGKATVNIAFGTGVTLSDGVRLMSWPEGTAPDNVDFVFADSTLNSNWVLVPGATGLTVSKPVVVVDNTASLDVASALSAATGTSKIRVMGDTSAAITLTDRQTLVVDSGVDYTGALTVNGGVAVLPAGAAPSAITIGANGVLAFDLTGQTIENGGVYTLTATEPTFSAAVDGPETCIFTIGPDFAGTIEYSDGALKATAKSAATGKTRQITMFISTDLYNDNSSAWSNGTPNDQPFGSASYDTTRVDIAVFPDTASMHIYGPNHSDNFTMVVRGGTLTLDSDSNAAQVTLTVKRLISTGTVVCDNFNLAVSDASGKMGGITASNGGSATVPAGGELGTVTLNGTSKLKVNVSSEPTTSDVLLTTAGDTTASAIASDQYMIKGEYDEGTAKTTWRAYARNAYISAWEDSFSDAGAVTANFSFGTVDNAILGTTARTSSGTLSTCVSQQSQVGEETFVHARIAASSNVNLLYTLEDDYASYEEQRIRFDWFAGAGYWSGNKAATNALVIVATDGTPLATIVVPHSGSNDSTATANIYKGDGAESVIGSLTGSIRGQDTSNAAYWYRITVSTSKNGVRLGIKNISLNQDVLLSNDLLSSTPAAVGKLAVYEVRTAYTQYSALANVSISIPDYLDMPDKPTIIANGTGRDVQIITLSASEGETIHYWTSLDSTVREYTAPFELPNTGTVYAYAQSQSGTRSLNATEYIYSNLGAIKLIAPTVCRRGFDRLYITVDERSLTGQPTPTFKYNVDDGDAIELAPGSTQLPQIENLKNKTVKVWATHELYGDSDVVTWSAPVSVSAEDYAIAFDLDYVQTFIDNPGTPAMNTSIDKRHVAEGEKNVFGSDEGYFYAVTCNSASLYDPVWYSINTANSTLRWKRGEYGLSQDNNASNGVWPEIMLADMKAGAKIYINANDAPQIQGNATLASSGNGEYVYTVSADGDCRFGIRRYVGGGSSGTAVNVHALRVYEPAVAKAGGVGYLTIDEAVAAAASTGGSVSVVDSRVVSGAAVALKPGVTLAGLENIAPSSVSVSTTINEETVDMTSYYKAESLAVVNGAIAPELADSVKVELSENAVAEGVDDVIAVTTTAPTFKLKNSVKKGLYYGVGTYDPESGTVTPQVEQRATSDNQGIILSPSFTFGDGTHVLYYKLMVSDTPTVNN